MAQNLITRKNQGGGLTTRGQQYHPLDLFRREMDSLFSRFFGDRWLAPVEEDFGQMGGFDVDVNDKEIVVRADVPGFDESELDIRLEGDVLTIQAEKEQKGDGQQAYRSFYRQVTLPSGVDAEKVQANYRNGVLELHVPRPEGDRVKRIMVKGQQAGAGSQTFIDKSGGDGGNGSHAGEQAGTQKATT